MELKKPCTQCDGEAVYSQYTYRANVAGVTVSDPRQMAYVCKVCGEMLLTTGELAGLQRRAAMTALRDLPSIRGEALRYARKAAGLRQVDLARLLDIAPETISRYETSNDAVPRAVQVAMHGLLLLRESGVSLQSLIDAATKPVGATELVVPAPTPHAA